MGLFDFLKPKKELSEAERKWNLMWDMWVQGKSESPYTELMEYESEVNNGGHSQYFFNNVNCGDLKESIKILYAILPDALSKNLRKAYEAFAVQKDIADDVNDELFEECDGFFYENENLLIDILKEYANGLHL